MLVYLTLDCVYVVSNLCLNLEDNDKLYTAACLKPSAVFYLPIEYQSSK